MPTQDPLPFLYHLREQRMINAHDSSQLKGLDSYFIEQNLASFVLRKGEYYELSGEGYTELNRLDRQEVDSSKLNESLNLAKASVSQGNGMHKMTVAILIISALTLLVTILSVIL